MKTHWVLSFQTSLVAQTVKRLPTTRETWVRCLSFVIIPVQFCVCMLVFNIHYDFPGGTSGKGRGRKQCGFHPWVGKIPWRRAWQPTPVFLPGEPHGQGSLAGYSLWGSQRVRHNWSNLAHTLTPTVGNAGNYSHSWLLFRPWLKTD